MNISQLKALDAIAKEKTFSKAAAGLGVSQPAVSMQLRKLQETYRVRPYYRRGNEIVLTEMGEELVRKARIILGLLDDMERALSGAKNLEAGHLHIGLSCHYFVMELLASFMRRYPGIGVKAHIGDSDDLIDLVLSNHLDMAEITCMEPDPRFSNLLYSRQEIFVIASRTHAWGNKKSIPVQDLEGQAMVARHKTSKTRQVFESQLGSVGIKPKVMLELDTWDAMKEAVAAGIGFGIVLEDEFTPDERITPLRVEGAQLKVSQYFICLPEFRELSIVNAFFELAMEARDLEG